MEKKLGIKGNNHDIKGGIGILGGTFDPIHLGHIALCKNVRDHYSLSLVYLVPALMNPLRQNEVPIARPEDRLAMAELAILDEDGLLVDPFEIERKEIQSEPSYTIDTLEHLKARFQNIPLVLIVGADNVAFHKWHRAVEFPEHLARIAVVSRPEYESEMKINLEHVREILPELADIVDLLPIVDMPLSSTGIRESLRNGIVPGNSLHPDVERYVRSNRLYGLDGGKS